MTGRPPRLATLADPAAPAVRTQPRCTSASLHAWAMHPRGVYGDSASKISLIEPMQAGAVRRGEQVARLVVAEGAGVGDAAVGGVPGLLRQPTVAVVGQLPLEPV